MRTGSLICSVSLNSTIDANDNNRSVYSDMKNTPQHALSLTATLALFGSLALTQSAEAVVTWEVSEDITGMS